MNKLLFILCCLVFSIACTNSTKEKTQQPIAPENIKADTAVFPYQPLYSSQFNNEVSDKDLLTVLNSYKFWENGLLVDLAGLYADSVTFNSFDGNVYTGTKTGLLNEWTKKRDSMKAIQIAVIAWTKVHEIVKGDNYIDVWYHETDTYKSGKIAEANYADRKQVVNGKITWCSQYRQETK